MFAASFVALALLAGCRGDLVAPTPGAPEGTLDPVPMVQPYIRLIGPDGRSMPGTVDVDAAFYRADAGDLRFQALNAVSRFPEPIAAPFRVHINPGRDPGERLLLDVFPADADTIVVDWRESNARFALEPPEWLEPDDIHVSRVALEIRSSNRSEHLEVNPQRNRSWYFFFGPESGLELLTVVPPAIESVPWVWFKWSVDATPLSAGFAAEIEWTDIPFTGALELSVALQQRPLDLRPTWAGGNFELDAFDYWGSRTTGSHGRERVHSRKERDMPILPVVGWSGGMVMELVPRDTSVVFPWRGFIEWNGIDPVAVELGRYAFEIQVVDSSGMPVAFAVMRLSRAGSGSGSLQQSTDAQGRVHFFLNEDEYTLQFASDGSSWSSAGPRGGPWRVAGDDSVVWEVP